MICPINLRSCYLALSLAFAAVTILVRSDLSTAMAIFITMTVIIATHPTIAVFPHQTFIGNATVTEFWFTVNQGVLCVAMISRAHSKLLQPIKNHSIKSVFPTTFGCFNYFLIGFAMSIFQHVLNYLSLVKFLDAIVSISDHLLKFFLKSFKFYLSQIVHLTEKAYLYYFIITWQPLTTWSRYYLTTYDLLYPVVFLAVKNKLKNRLII